ncbi:MAG: hypothetical protein EOO99_11000 [Pedobacter sp.]|nr:MAG: hypothetical protein EOO99_11000 [Pedobacter sp.]
MATINGILDKGFKGKAGSYVGYLLNGKFVIRTIGKKKKYKGLSAKQKAPIDRFKIAHKFLKPIAPFIGIGFKPEAVKRMMNPYNLARSKFLLETLDANNVIQYEKLMLSTGILPSPRAASIQRNESTMTVNWAYDESTEQAHRHDQIILLCYEVNKAFATGILCEGNRYKGKFEFDLTSSNKRKFKVWMGFISIDRSEASDSVYLGEF